MYGQIQKAIRCQKSHGKVQYYILGRHMRLAQVHTKLGEYFIKTPK